MKLQMFGKDLILRIEQVGMLKFLIPDEQQCVMREWMVDFAQGKMRWRMWMKVPHCQILQCSFLPESF